MYVTLCDEVNTASMNETQSMNRGRADHLRVCFFNRLFFFHRSCIFYEWKNWVDRSGMAAPLVVHISSIPEDYSGEGGVRGIRGSKISAKKGHSFTFFRVNLGFNILYFFIYCGIHKCLNSLVE